MPAAVVLSIIALVVSSVSAGNGDEKSDRLYGSRDAVDGQFPYAAFHMVRTAQGVGTCTASLLTQRWTVIAAHCVNQYANVPRNHLIAAGKADISEYLRLRLRTSFQVGINDGVFDTIQERRADKIYFHPNYTRLGNNDIGLVRVARPFILNPRVALIPLTREPFLAEMPCTIVGYGVVENDVRKHIQQYISEMPARPAALCRHQRTRDVICLGDVTRGICHGDSGGPLVCQGRLSGVASHGLIRGGSIQSCGVGTVEQYYTDAHLNLLWIDAMMALNPVSKKRKINITVKIEPFAKWLRKSDSSMQT